MNQAVTITIGATLGRSFLQSFTSADSRVRTLTASVTRLSATFGTATRATNTWTTALGRLGTAISGATRRTNAMGTAVNNATGNVNANNAAVRQATASMHRQANAAARVTAALNAQAAAARAAAAANAALRRNPPPGAPPGGGGGAGGAGNPNVNGIGGAVGAYGGWRFINSTSVPIVRTAMSFESDMADLRSSMMDKMGATPMFKENYDQIIDLANKLPGTPQEFVRMATTLRRFGKSAEDMHAGLNEGTAKMAVLTKTDPALMAEALAQASNAIGIAGKDMLGNGGFVDFMQRSHFMGMNATEMAMALSRSGGAMNAMRMTGVDNSKDVMTLYTMLGRMGISPERIGTNFAAMLNGLSKADKLEKANNILAGEGGKPMRFHDSSGKFLGMDNMVQQFDNLKRLAPRVQKQVMTAIFGGGFDEQIGEILIGQGKGGYDKIRQEMENQANLDQRVNEILKTSSSKWEAMTGAFTNMVVTMGTAVLPYLNPIIDSLGGFFGATQQFFEQYPAIGGGIVLGLGAIGTAITGLGTILTVRSFFGAGGMLNGFSRAATMLWNGVRWLGPRIVTLFSGAVGRFAPLMSRALGPIAAIITAAVVGWKIGEWIEEKTGLGTKLGEKIADWIWGDTEKRAKKVPDIVEQTIKNAETKGKGIEANAQRQKNMAAMEAQRAKLMQEWAGLSDDFSFGKMFETEEWANAMKFKEDDLKVVEGQIRNQAREIAQADVATGDPTKVASGQPVLDFFSAQAKMRKAGFWHQSVGADTLGGNLTAMHDMVQSGKLGVSDIEAIIRGNDLANVPETDKLTPGSMQLLKDELLPMAKKRAAEAGGAPVYQIQQLHVNNPVGDMKDIHKYVPGLVQKEVNKGSNNGFARDRGSLYDMHAHAP